MKLCLQCERQFASPDWRCPNCGWTPARVAGRISFAPELAAADGSFPPDQFPHLAALEENYFWFRARNALLIWALRKYFGRARSFLEIGCGTGYVLKGLAEAFPDLSVSGAELLDRGLAIAERRAPRATFFQADAQRLPFAEEFDVVGAFDVLEHVNDDRAILRQMHQAVRPGGGILVTVPQHRWLWGAVDDQARHRRRYDRGDLVRKAADAGFRVLFVTSYVAALLPFMFLWRNRRRPPASLADPIAEFRIHPLLNRFFEIVLAGERFAIKRGVRFPVGGSLLLIAARLDAGFARP
jgi:SAM-dependent methyltransferase